MDALRTARSDDFRVVIADDSRFDLEVARQALDGVARLELCEDAESALAALAREPAQLVVSDLNMPGLSGVQLLERVRREHPGTDFVLLTGDGTLESAIEALRMGATDYLIKPVQGERLRRVVEQALLRRRLFEENRSLRDALHTVESCRVLSSCLDAGEVYAVTLDLLLNTLSRSRGLALFHRSSIPSTDAAAFRGFSEGEARRLREILVEEKPLSLDEFDEIGVLEQGPMHEVLSRAGIRRQPLLAVPVRGEESEAGVIWVFEDGRSFEDEERDRAAIITSHARISLRNSERYNHAKERAFIDDVTEVYNARYLLSAAENEIQRAKRYVNPLSVLFLDLDRFKLVNDRHGHLVGSETLRRLSQLLLQCVRQVDTLARYGGDEFTILLVDTGHEEALVIAERIRRTVEEHLFEAGRDATLRLTVSLGVATYPEHGTVRDPLLDTADKAMYRAKSLGRNRVCSADELTS
ncbi:MAG: diguanylate cyclase [Proteobacteria bacterium]|nr:diguanylate cyclase [Pseudomonadota bacterium]